MPQLQALIFDVDGTLADTERDGHRIAFNRAFAESGLDWEWTVERYGELLETTGGKERLQRYLKEDQPDYPLATDAPTWAATIHKLKTKHYKALIQAGSIPLRPGVQRLIQEAREAGMRLAIATTTTPENVTALLEAALAPDSLSWFEVIAAGDIVPAKKPAPDIYLYTLEKMGLKPEDCLALEDSQNGLESAAQAGLKTVITLNDYTKNHNFSGAAIVLDQFGEPDAPFQVIAGNSGEKSYFDLALARSLVEAQ